MARCFTLRNEKYALGLIMERKKKFLKKGFSEFFFCLTEGLTHTFINKDFEYLWGAQRPPWIFLLWITKQMRFDMEAC